MMTTEQRFMRHVQKTDGCWIWCGSRYQKGYGRVRIAKTKTTPAHRRAYELFVGPIPEGLDILHSCDNPPCVRPDHLRPGTNADNVRDKMQRGRFSPSLGEKNGCAKVTEAIVREIRASSDILRVLAERYNLSTGHVWAIKNRFNWKEVA